MDARGRLSDVLRLFLRLGTTAFGGPAAHLDLVAAAQLVPGPNSTELAIHLGYRRAGWPGLLVAGAAFIVSAMLWSLVVLVRFRVHAGWLMLGGGLVGWAGRALF